MTEKKEINSGKYLIKTTNPATKVDYYLACQDYYKTDVDVNNSAKVMCLSKDQEGKHWKIGKKEGLYEFKYDEDKYDMNNFSLFVNNENNNSVNIGRQLGSGFFLEREGESNLFKIKDLLTGMYLSCTFEDKSQQRDNFSFYIQGLKETSTTWEFISCPMNN